MDIQTIDLFGKSLFSMLHIEQLVQIPAPMPENEAAFVYILEGKCVNYTELEDFHLEKGQAVLAKSGNGIFKTLMNHQSPRFKAISIRFHKDVFEKLYVHDSAPFFKRSETALTTNSVMVKPNLLIDQFIKGLVILFENKDQVSERLMILKLKELVTLLLQSHYAPEVRGIMSNLFTEKTFEFQQIINAHIFSPIKISDLAQLTHHSLSSFKKEFKKNYNDTPKKYIIKQRIEKVAQLLSDSNDSISNIAYDCEFKTLAHMSRVFKAQYGVSPSQYRKTFSGKY